jgi:hypothetical protein
MLECVGKIIVADQYEFRDRKWDYERNWPRITSNEMKLEHSDGRVCDDRHRVWALLHNQMSQ